MAEETEDSSTGKSSLKPAQLAASALAAVTAAFLGSTLGVGGTVAGAGIASVVTTVGGEFYLRSLRRTRAAARKTAKVFTDTRLRQETSNLEPPPRRPGNPLMQPAPPRRGQLPATQLNQIQRTTRIPTAGSGGSGLGERTVYIPRPGAPVPRQPGPHGMRPAQSGADAPTRIVPQPDRPSEGPQGKKPWWKNRWTLIAASSVAAFVIGMLAITGFEGITGHAVSGGEGTTFSQVVRGSPTTGKSSTPTSTEQPATSDNAPSSTARSTKPSAPVQETAPSSSVQSTPTQQAPASRGVQQSESAQPTESAAPTSG